jgi:uncharacterized protein YjeT (DUF2065 family)
LGGLSDRYDSKRKIYQSYQPYPSDQADQTDQTDLDDLVYPSAWRQVVLDDLVYPSAWRQAVLDDLVYPSAWRQAYLGGLLDWYDSRCLICQVSRNGPGELVDQTYLDLLLSA